MANDNIFNAMSEGIINTLTYLINSYSGILQITIYLVIGISFFYALYKAYQSLRTLGRFDFSGVRKKPQAIEFSNNISTPLSAIAASFFYKAKKHYHQEKKNDPNSHKTIPPDSFIRDAAFQYSERYFEEKFLDPISMMANLMPPLGFIGTIIGMVVHFLSNSGSLNSGVTVAGIATALYTTFIGLVSYTFLEFLLKIFYFLAHKRIDEGLAAISEAIGGQAEQQQ